MNPLDEIERQRHYLAIAGYATTIAALVLLVATAFAALFSKFLFLRFIDDERTSPAIRQRKKHYVRLIDIATVFSLSALGLTVFGAASTGVTSDRVIAAIKKALAIAPPGGISGQEAAQLRQQIKDQQAQFLASNADRDLSGNALASFITAAKAGSGTVFDTALNDGDPEALDLLSEVEPALFQAGWKQVDFTGNTIRYGERGRLHGAITISGIVILYHISADKALKQPALTLQKAFLAAKLPAQISISDWKPLSQGGSDLSVSIIHLVIGKKVNLTPQSK